MLKFVKCEIIGITASDVMTAYLLSESSMFVSRERLILKTCGRTTILNVLTPLLDCVKKNIGGYSIKVHSPRHIWLVTDYCMAILYVCRPTEQVFKLHEKSNSPFSYMLCLL